MVNDTKFCVNNLLEQLSAILIGILQLGAMADNKTLIILYRSSGKLNRL